MRLAYGIVLGFYAWGLIGLQKKLLLSPQGWVARRAAIAILRMYSLSGGIDEGALGLLEEWGEPGRACLHDLLRRNRVPSAYLGYARILAGEA